MGGIAGIVDMTNDCTDLTMITKLIKMSARLRHRGPDDEGYIFGTNDGSYTILGGEDTPSQVLNANLDYTPNQKIQQWLERQTRIVCALGLVNRRLGVCGLSSAEHQPICNEDRNLWITCDGEIYNFKELNAILSQRGHRLLSQTGAELIVHCYEEWAQDCLEKLNGAFSFALWDISNKKLFCARDRLGLKPLYYHMNENSFLFASEIKALLECLPAGVNERIAYEYLVKGLVGGSNETFFEGINQLLGGEYLVLSLSDKSLVTDRFWQIDWARKLQGLSDKQYAQRFFELLMDSCRMRTADHVPTGVFLSGGLDSSTIVSCLNLLAQTGAGIPDTLDVYCARFNNSEYDEGKFMKSVIDRTGAKAHYFFPTVKCFIKDLDDLVYYTEQPFVFAIHPQWLACKEAKRDGIKVIFDGQGGDELMAGYPDPHFGEYLHDLMRSSRWLEVIENVGRFLGNSKIVSFHELLGTVRVLLPRFVKNRLDNLLGLSCQRLLNPEFQSTFCQQTRPRALPRFTTKLDQALYESLVSNLSDALRISDKVSMAHSIQTRSPFLDHRLVEYLFSTPSHQKIRLMINKYILRESMKGILPENVRLRRDKKGFYTCPYERFRKCRELGEFVKHVLWSKQFSTRPFFNVDEIRKAFSKGWRGPKRIFGDYAILRCVIMELWMRKFIDSR